MKNRKPVTKKLYLEGVSERYFFFFQMFENFFLSRMMK